MAKRMTAYKTKRPKGSDSLGDAKTFSAEKTKTSPSRDVLYQRPKGGRRTSGVTMVGTLSGPGLPTVNRVTSGPGSSRYGKRPRVMRGSDGDIYHVYGRGKKAKKVHISSAAAKAYGYNKAGL